MATESLVPFGETSFDMPAIETLPSPRSRRSKIQLECSRGIWNPPSAVTKWLPDGFNVPIDCYLTDAGERRFLPRCSLEELIDLGAVGGLAVIHSIRGFDPDVDRSYRFMHLVLQYVRGRGYRGEHGMREHLLRSFRYSRDIYIRQSGRQSLGTTTVLPESPDDLGTSQSGSSAKAVSQRGRKLAAEDGHANPTNEIAINYGLYAAAARSPLFCPDHKVASLVRIALFDLDRIEPQPDEELVGYVQARLLAAMERHLNDSREDFAKWYFASNNSVIKQIAKQKTAPGGELAQSDVRQAMLCLGWRAYQYVGQCVHALMRTIQNSIRPSLTHREQTLFQHMFEAQPYYAGFPLALLAERMDFLRTAVLRIWGEPDNPTHVAVLHRLLFMYAAMASDRRAADRHSKSTAAGPALISLTDFFDNGLDDPDLIDNERSKSGMCPNGRRHGPTDASGDDGPSDASLNTSKVAVDPPDPETGPRRYRSDDDRDEHAGRTARLVRRPFLEIEAPKADSALINGDLTEHIRELRGIGCKRRCSRWFCEIEREANGDITLWFTCACDEDPPQKVRMTREQLLDIVRPFQDP